MSKNKNEKKVLPKNFKECVIPLAYGAMQTTFLLAMWGAESVENADSSTKAIELVKKFIDDLKTVENEHLEKITPKVTA